LQRPGGLFEVRGRKTRRRVGTMAADKDGPLKGRQFTADDDPMPLRRYRAFPISYRDLALMLSGWGVGIDYTTLFRRVQTCAAMLEQQVQRRLQASTGSWRVDEAYIKVKGAWTYLYREFLAAAAVQVPEQHRRGGSQADQTAGPAGAWLR
jgi:hypothetical protein